MIETVERCAIQEGCVYPVGHMGNCSSSSAPTPWLEGVAAIPRDPCSVHGFPTNPEPWKSGKLIYKICPACMCVEKHVVHGWVAPAREGTPTHYVDVDLASANYAPVYEETIEQLLHRVQVIPEPELMDIEDDGAMQVKLFQRAQVLATLHQAKQLERIADSLEKMRLQGARLVGPAHEFEPDKGSLYFCGHCGFERTHPVHG